LLNPGAFSSGEAVYLWWLVLRLCFIPLMNAVAQPLESVVEEGIRVTATDASSDSENPMVSERGAKSAPTEEGVEP
ncbi:MAG: hypothetical protein ACRDGS_01770, partial [Chloroflexota bacterium]